MAEDIVVIGAGWTGSVMAHLYATVRKRKVLVLERQPFVSGHSHDFLDTHGIRVQKFGAHLFHTSDEEVWKFVNRFSGFNGYVHYVKTRFRGELYDWPITLDTIQRVYDRELRADQAQELLKAEGLEGQVDDPAHDNFEMTMIRQVGRRLYEMFIKNYTEKMWQRPAASLSAELAFRVPLRLDNDKRLFKDVYQGVPSEGYTELIRRMLEHPNIRVELNTDYRAMPLSYQLLICTAPIDVFYGCRCGKLEYRGMRFEFVTKPGTEFNGFGTLNTPDDPRVLRLEEHKQYTRQSLPVTTLGYNYAMDGSDEPFYPVPTMEQKNRAQAYRDLAAKETNVVFAGRLGLYKYIDQHVAVREALDLFTQLA
jgi:UDP-galactopyranose mutase